MILESFSSVGPSEFLVVSRTRWDKHQRKLGTHKKESRSMAQELEELAENQGGMGHEGSPVKAPPHTRRRMTPPMLQLNSFSLTK